MDVVGEQSQRPHVGQRPHGQSGEIELPKQLLVGGEALQAVVVVPGERPKGPLQDVLGRRPIAGLRRRNRREDRTHEKEWPPEFLVGGHGHGREPSLRCELDGREQQSRLPDPGLALQGDRGQSLLSRGQLGFDGGQLGRASHHGGDASAHLKG